MNFCQKNLLIFFITAASIIATFLTPEIGLLKKHFSLDDSYLSAIMTSYLFGYLGGQLFFTLLSKKFNCVLSIKLGFFVATIGLILQYVAVKYIAYHLFIFSRTISAWGLSSGLVCGFVIIKKNINKKEEKSYLSWIAIAFTSSIYFSVFISGTLAQYNSLDVILKSEIFYIVVLFLLSFFIKKEQKSEIPTFEKTSLYSINFSLISYALVLSITTIIAYCYSLYGALIMINHFGLTPQAYVSYNLLNLGGLFLGSLFYNHIHKIISENVLLLFCLGFILASSAGLIISASYHEVFNLDGFVFSFFLINLFCGIIYPAATFQSLESGTCKHTSSGIMNMIKIGMPIVAFALSFSFEKDIFFRLTGTIALFSGIFSLFLVIVYFRRYRRIV